MLLFEPDSSNQQCVNVSPAADTVLEEDERFSAVLSTSNPDVSINRRFASVVILDNDGESFY